MSAREHSGAFGEFGGDGDVGWLEHFVRLVVEGGGPPRFRGTRGASGQRFFLKFCCLEGTYKRAKPTDRVLD